MNTCEEKKSASFQIPTPRWNAISKVEEEEYRAKKIETVVGFWKTLTDEERKRIVCIQSESPDGTGLMCRFIVSDSLSKNVPGSEWDEWVRARLEMENEKNIPSMSNQDLAEFIRGHHEHKHAIAEALARILER